MRKILLCFLLIVIMLCPVLAFAEDNVEAPQTRPTETTNEITTEKDKVKENNSKEDTKTKDTT